jgi:PEP-CTERM motif
MGRADYLAGSPWAAIDLSSAATARSYCAIGSSGGASRSQSGAGSFTGTGTVEYNGDLRPGNSPARVTYEGEVLLNPSATLFAELGGLSPGSQYDEVTVLGSISVGGHLQLQFINGFQPAAGDSFKLIENRGVSPIFGTFIGVPEGGTVTASGINFTATYLGGNGHDFVLTAVPEPGALALGGLAAIGWVAYWRRRWARNRTDSDVTHRHSAV